MSACLTAGLVEVRSANLERLNFDEASLRRWLVPEEWERASRLHRLEQRARFLTARAWLRCVLGRQLACAPEAVILHTGEFGKPVLKSGSAQPELHFNLSHTGEFVVCALSRDGEVGIDIEQIRPAAATPEVAGQFLTASELAEVFAHPPMPSVVEFFRRWTLKEAVLKAAGTGLRASPHEVILERVPSADGAEVHWRADFSGQRWAVREFTFAPDVAGALALAGDTLELRLQRWS